MSSEPSAIGLLDPTDAGNRITEWRLRTRRSQKEMATLLGVSTAAVNRHESGNRGISHPMVMKYALSFKVPTYALFIRPVPRYLEADPKIREEYAVGNRVKELREHVNLTIQELAKLSNFYPASLRLVEEGVWGLTHDEILALARVFKVPTYQIFTRPVVVDSFDTVDTEAYAEAEEEASTAVTDKLLTLGDRGTPYENYPGGPHAQVITGTGL